MFNSLTATIYHKFPALSHKSFRNFWFGQFISLLGTGVQRTAQQWLIYSITKSAFLLGVLGVAQFGPMLVFSLFAGVYVDKFSKKRILMLVQLVQVIQAIILAVIVLLGYVQYWHVLLLAVVLGFSNTIEMPTRNSIVIELVGKRHLTNAIALNSTAMNLTLIISPTIAAFLIDNLGIGTCFLLNAVSFIPITISLYYIKEQSIITRMKSESLFKSISEGLHYIVKNPILLSSVISMVVISTFAMNMNIILPVFADDILHQGVNGYGLLLSARGLGSLVGAAWMVVVSGTIPNRRLVLISALLTSGFISIFGLMVSFPMALIFVAASGVFNMIFITSINTRLQIHSSNEFRGRMMSLYALALSGTTPIGSLFAGGLAESFGADTGIIICGILSGVLSLVVFVMIKDNRSKPTMET